MSLIQVINDFFKTKPVDQQGNPFFTQNNPGKVEVTNQKEIQKVEIMDELKKHFPLKETPYPPKITDVELLDNPSAGSPKFMTSDGTLWYSHETEGLKKSEDGGLTLTHVMDNPPTSSPATSLIISDTGRVIWGTFGKTVFVSDENKSSWSSFQFPSGYSHRSYGHFKYKNIILMATYGILTPPSHAGYLWASFDSGENWNQIYGYEGSFEGDRLHVHDVAYDPWADRIWLSFGDNPNEKLLYSDDRGATWTTLDFVEDDPDNRFAPTVILPGPHSVMFGSDQWPDGIDIWVRPQSPLQPEVKKEDIIRGYYQLDTNTTDLRNIFHNKIFNLEGDKPLFIISVSSEAEGKNGYPRIIISRDGLNFHEIWKGEQDEMAWKVTDVSPDGKIYVAASKNREQNYYFSLQIPEFK